MIRPILAAAALSIAAMPALAATTDKFEMNVNIDRSTLQTTEGAQQEFVKLKQDVRKRCVAETTDWGFANSYAVNFCESRTLKSAVTAINEPALTAVYEASVSR